MPQQEQASLWSDTAVKMLDVRSGTVPPGGMLIETELASNQLLLAIGGQGGLVMNGEGCHVQASFACHAAKGSAYTLSAGSDNIHYTAISYKAIPVAGAAHVLFPERNHPLRTSFVHHSAPPASCIWRRRELQRNGAGEKGWNGSMPMRCCKACSMSLLWSMSVVRAAKSRI